MVLPAIATASIAMPGLAEPCRAKPRRALRGKQSHNRHRQSKSMEWVRVSNAPERICWSAVHHQDMMLTQLAEVARRTGYPVVETPGWKTRGRGPMEKIETVLVHHTAGPADGDMPSLRTLVEGRPDLRPPLAHYGVARSGRIYVVGAGLANHAGAVRRVSWGNAHAIGIEVENRGVPGDLYPEPQLDAAARLCAALQKEFGVSTASVLGHREVCSPVGRKVDPSFDMGQFRSRVARVSLGSAPTPPPSAKEDDAVDWKTPLKVTAPAAEALNKIDGDHHQAGDEVSIGHILTVIAQGLAELAKPGA